MADTATIEHPQILFFSDAHLGAHPLNREAIKVERFVAFMQHATRIEAEIFFLGDLFDFWFEYRHWIPKVPIRVLSAIHDFTMHGGAFHMLLGNHDVWAADYFGHELGVRVYREDLSVTRQGLRILISHGDGKAPSDRGYRVLKRILRFRPNVLLYRLLPADWAYRLATSSSRQSRQLTSSRTPRFLEEYDAVAAAYLKTGYDAVVMGHIHQAWVRRVGSGWWVNSGEFFERFSYVNLREGEFHLEAWNPEPGSVTTPSEQDSKLFDNRMNTP